MFCSKVVQFRLYAFASWTAIVLFRVVLMNQLVIQELEAKLERLLERRRAKKSEADTLGADVQEMKVRVLWQTNWPFSRLIFKAQDKEGD